MKVKLPAKIFASKLDAVPFWLAGRRKTFAYSASISAPLAGRNGPPCPWRWEPNSKGCPCSLAGSNSVPIT